MRTFERHRKRVLRIVSVALLVGSVAAWPGILAADEESEKSEKPAEPAELPVIHEEVQVLAEAPEVEVESVEIDLVHAGREANLGVAVAAMPGVAGVRKAQNAADPVVRGLGRERVQTQVNGMPLNHACPARMDPPSTVMTASSIQEAKVVKGLASVTLGPGGTGGRIMVSTDYDRGATTGSETHPWVRTSYNSARDGYTLGAAMNGGSGALDYSVGLETLKHGDYTSASGTQVPANQEESGGYATIGHRITETQRWTLNAVYRNGENVDYPALPMNSDSATTRIFNGTYVFEPAERTGKAPVVEAKLGYSSVDHLMSNRGKPNRPMMEAEAEGVSDTWGAHLSARWSLSGRSLLQAGTDYNGLSSDALRERRMVMNGMTSYDHIWPDASQDDVGLFAEYSQWIGAGWQLRIGSRYDFVSSSVAAADDPSLGGRTVRENYVRFYGPEAAVTDRDEGLWSANAMVSRDFSATLSAFVGIGLVQRPASVTERYYAFAPAPGGFTVGNPTLDPEQKNEISAGVNIETGIVKTSVSVFYHSVDDFIKDVTLMEMDMNGDEVIDLIRGFENVDATLYGGEITAVFNAGSRFTIPTALFYTRGEYGTESLPLPEIPPLEGRAAARMTYGNSKPGWVELGGRFVAEQTRVDPNFPIAGPPGTNENPTPGFAVWHLRASIPLHRYLNLEVGVENLFDKEYWEHLSRETFAPVGDLQRGQEVPQPGRWLFVGLQFRM